MKEDKTTPLRERMIEDMRIRGLGAKTQQAHIRAVRYFAEFVGRSPDAATPDELRAYQLHMTNTGVSIGVFNARIVSLRFFFGVTCAREEMKRYMQFRRKGYEAFSWCAVSPANPRQDPSHGLQANHYWAVERWHQTLKNRILLENYFLPGISKRRSKPSSITTTTSVSTKA
jgi:hypothetical protein